MYHNSARELSLVQSVHSGSVAMPRGQCLPVVLTAGKERSEI